MSNSIIIIGNQRSAIVDALDKATESNLGYGIPRNIPNSAPFIVALDPQIAPTTFAGQIMTYKLPKNCKYTNMYFHNSFTTATSSSDASTVDNLQLGGKAFEYIELRSSTRVLCRNDEHVILCRTDDAKWNESKALSRMMNPHLTFTTTQTLICQTPIFFPWFENKGSYLDGYFVEQLYVVAKGNTLLNMGLVNSTISACTIKLYVEGYNLDPEEEKKLVAINFKQSKPLTYFGYNYNTEVFPMVSGSTSSTVPITCNNFVSKMWIYARTDATGVRHDLTNTWATAVTVTLKLSGQTVIDAVPLEALVSSRSRKGASGAQYFSVAATGDAVGDCGEWNVRPICIDFTLAESNKEYSPNTFKSGGVSLFQQTSPQVIITHANPSTGKTLYIVEEYIKLTSIDPTNGVFLEAAADN